MKTTSIRILTIFFAVLFAVTTLGGCKSSNQDDLQAKLDRANYGAWYRKENTTADQSYLFGMCGIVEEHTWDNPDFSWSLATELCKNLGVKSIRTWLHFQYVMDTDRNIIEEEAEKYHAHFAQQKEYGMQTIAMCHFSLLPNGTFSCRQVPSRNTKEGSVYMQWLEDYEECWYTLVSEFPEVTYWEIGNENTGDYFMGNYDGDEPFSFFKKAQIFTDMMFFASRGIHRANPNATTVMGGIVGDNITFLNNIYDTIFAENSWSHYPDDYFQVAAWHPYKNQVSLENINDWVKLQQDTYAVIKTREGKDKKVFFTEFGWSDARSSAETINFGIMATYSRIKKDLPFVEAAHYFRLFDRIAHVKNDIEKRFGLFNDPNTADINSDNYLLGAPKAFALLYQQLAGGSGDLTIFQKWAESNS